MARCPTTPIRATAPGIAARRSRTPGAVKTRYNGAVSETLGTLRTDLGDRSSYDAVSQCSRCGYCEQACPTYKATGLESHSPRGRNQLVRLILEGKLKDPRAAEEALSTCLLCGACQTACYAHVSVPDLVLEGRRALRERPHRLVRAATRLLVERPAMFDRLMRLAFVLKKLGLSALGRPLLRWIGLGGLAVADSHLENPPLRFLRERLASRPTPENPARVYFAACGPNYLFPEVGESTVAALESLEGPVAPLKTGCCGLLSFNYGELEHSRVLAKRVIESAEHIVGSPIVGDCSSCVAFLKSYPQLFLNDPAWLPRAEQFSARIKDAVEDLNRTLPELPGAATATYHESCRACHGQGLRKPDEMMSSIYGSRFRALPESDSCCGGAGAFSFIHPELSEDILKRKISMIASTGATVVATSSTSCLLQLAAGLKKYYPQAEVVHASRLVARALRPDGTKTRA